MAEVTGPISTLPGAGHHVPEGTMCDDHPDRPAVVRIQGETDSMGAELNDMCQECFNEYKEAVKNEDTSGICDWCSKPAPKLRHRRDYDEGLHGPVYLVCDGCSEASNKRLAEELSVYEDAYDDYDDPEDLSLDEEPPWYAHMTKEEQIDLAWAQHKGE